MLAARASPATVNQALAAVTLMYEQAGLRIAVKRVRIPRPGEPDALTRSQEAALRRAAARRGPRDAAIIAVLLDTGARVEECARLDAGDFAITARTGEVRLHGKGDEVRSVPLSRPARDLVSAWLDVRGRHPGPAWTGQRGPLTDSGITQVVLAAGNDANIPGLRPHRCRHTFATRLPVAKAVPTQPRCRPCSVTPRSTPQPGTSDPARPRTPPSSSGSSATNAPLTSPLPLLADTTTGSPVGARQQTLAGAVARAW
jgi:integrase